MAILSREERDVLKVIKNGITETENTTSLKSANSLLGSAIASSEELLRSLGYEERLNNVVVQQSQNTPRIINMRSFNELLSEANRKYPDEVDFSDILSPQEMAKHTTYIAQLNEEFNTLHRLDKIDIIMVNSQSKFHSG